ncbi:MAG: tyrosine--tRNA ligase [Longimicrobiales bacterium]
MTDFASVVDQMDAIRRDTVEIVPETELARTLEASRRAGRPLCIKQGFDPTWPDLHIGHAVSIRKLRTFQELGHDVVFVVGDYTARIGDPTGRSETRPRMSPAEIEANARTYADQVSRLLDVTKVRVEYNSRWLAPLDLAAILELAATYTVARMLERDDFAKRYADRQPISVSEFLYPLMQAYDSVALRADVELGGTDQMFNLLAARTVQERYGQEPQVCVIMPLLRGTDGVQKMSKSYDNYIGITERAEEQYGKTMSIPDALLGEWYRLAAALPEPALAGALERVETDPYGAKRALAHRVVEVYHGEDAARAAASHFDRVFRERAAPDALPETRVSLTDPAVRYSQERGVWVPGLLVKVGLAPSNSEAQRLLEQGAISADGERLHGRDATLAVTPGDRLVLRRGKRHFANVMFQS